MMASEGYDYVIVGGGSAGCVMANRLSENDAVRVLLIEAGGKDSHPLIHMPVGFAKMTSGPHTWGFTTAPQKHANMREIPYAQARVIGGGSSINAEIYTRGNPVDYDRWATEEGCEGWAYDEVKDCFIRSEGNTILSGDWHGTDGPLGVSNLADPQGAPLLRRCRLTQAGDAPEEPDSENRLSGSPYHCQERPRHRCRLPARRSDDRGCGRPRGYRHLRRHRHAEADVAVGDRSRRPSG